MVWLGRVYIEPKMNAEVTHLAIRTGSCFTLVTVDPESNQCTVTRRDGGQIFYSGTGERSIKNAARDGDGQSFRTLKGLRESVETSVSVRRAREYDL